MARVWILSGSVLNWQYGVRDSVWAVTKSYKKSWDRLIQDDLFFLHASKPVSGLIGVAKATTKWDRTNDSPYWLDEKVEKRIKYPYGIKFQAIYLLPAPEWEKKRINIKGLGIKTRAGLSTVRSASAREKVIGLIKREWGVSLDIQITEFEDQ